MTILALLLCAAPTPAQWITQQIKLTPGYNPVYLQVTPAKSDCESVFGSNTAIQHVWMYNRYLQTSTFTTNPTDSAVSQDHWLTWFPSSGNKGFLSTLAQVRGGQAYLVFLATNSAPVTLSVQGIPAAPRVDWIPFDLVLTGFPVAETGKVTFYQFLKDCSEVSTMPGSSSSFYSINQATAREFQIRNPELTAILPGRAYWTRLGGHTANPFPVSVVGSDEQNSVQFPQDSRISSITLINRTTKTSQTVRLRLLDSETAPSGKPIRAGTVPLVALIPQADGSYSQRTLTDGLDITLTKQETLILRLGLDSTLLTPTTLTNATYQAILEVTEATHGFRQLVPVVAQVPGSKLSSQKSGLLALKEGISVRSDSESNGIAPEALTAGLWVGSLSLNAVNQPGFSLSTNPDPAQYPVTAATPMEVRALIHVNSNGVSSLLQQVFFAQVNEGSNKVVRMFSNINKYPAGAVHKSRISAPTWPGIGPAEMNGSFGGTLSATVNVPFNDRLNPFVHRYHPDHDNLATDFKTPLAANNESFDISRQVKFFFGATSKSGTKYSPAVPSLKFKGAAGEYATTSPFTNTPTFTVQFWANIPSSVQQGATMALLTNNTTHQQFKIAFQTNTGNLAITVQNSSGTIGTVAMTNSVPLGRWFNITTAYYGVSANVYIDGILCAYGALPALANGLWDAAWLGNTATNGTASFIGEIHDFIVRNSAISMQVVPIVMAVPEMVDGAGIQIELQGDAMVTNIVNRTAAKLTIAKSSSSIVHLPASPATPPWTFGSAQGYYTETITGLRKQGITVNGSFQFTRVSQDSTLR